MPNRRALQRRALERLPHPLDILDDRRCIRAGPRVVLHARRRAAVQVLAADRDADDEVGEGRAVRGDGGFQRGEFVGDDGLARGAPDAEEEGGGGGDGRRDGGDGVGGGSALLLVGGWVLVWGGGGDVDEGKGLTIMV